MNVPVIDLDAGLNRLALAKVQQILMDAALLGADELTPPLREHAKLICRGVTKLESIREQIATDVRDVLEHDELYLWLYELGAEQYAGDVVGLVHRLMRGEQPHPGLFVSLGMRERVTPRRQTVVYRRPTGKLGLFGVTPYGEKYKAACYDPSKRRATHIGYYDTPEAAALAYNAYVIERGLDKPLNEVERV